MNDNNDAVDEFRDAYPDGWMNMISDVVWQGDSIRLELNGGHTIAPSVTKPLLKDGWVVASHYDEEDCNKYWFHRLDIEEREVTRTITETETVATMENVS